MSSPAKFVRLGKILHEWGVRGQVRFISFNPESDLYPKLSYFLSEDLEALKLEIESVKPHGRYWLLKLKGYDGPEAASKLRGRVLGLSRDELPKPSQGQIYLSDLEGLTVNTAEGRRVGIIVGFMRVGDNEVMKIEQESGSEALVPYHSEFVERTDLKNGIIELKPFAESLL